MTSKTLFSVAVVAAFLAANAVARAQTTLAIATVNNPDMVVMQKHSSEFEKATGIKLKWLLLEENVLRQRVTTDIATKGGQFDVITIGMYETPLWGKANWLVPFDDTPESYDLDDVIPTVRDGLSYMGKLYSLPFYAESTMTFYRTDLFEKAGLKMPDIPTWSQIAEFAAKLNDSASGIHGLCLRGQPGWGENMSIVGLLGNVWGGQLFDMKWKPGYDSQPWKEAVKFYVEVGNKYGPPGMVGNGFNENLGLFASGHCGIWVDATVAAGFLFDPRRSQVSDKVGFAQPPIEKWHKGNGWLWAWALGVPTSSTHVTEAKQFVEWATSKDYVKMIGQNEGWVTVPPGTRISTYDNAAYRNAAPFAKATLDAIEAADSIHATRDPKPYQGITWAAIPEMQAIGNFTGQQIAAALTGKMTVDAALETAGNNAERVLKQAGYYK